MVAGKMVKDDTDLKTLKLKDGLKIILMGTAEGGELKAPGKETTFVEDLSAEERARILKEKTGEAVPAGLVNLGNTCYMNSVVQNMKKVKELTKALREQQPDENMPEGSRMLMMAAADLFEKLESKGEAVTPYQFVQGLRVAFPQFDQTDNSGHHMQQDAEECWSQLIDAFKRANLKKEIDGKQVNLVDHLFDIEFESTTKNALNPDEPAQIDYETQKKLLCQIDVGGQPINSIQDGIEAALTTEIEKYSEAAGGNQVYQKSQKINKLPAYLPVHMNRFFWKKDSASAGTSAGKTKILRNVSFPLQLDLFNYCSDELKASLKHGRDYAAKERREEDERMLSGKAMEEEKKEEGKQEKRPQVLIDDSKVYAEHGLGLDTGNYHLIGVVTHQGRSADSGHYVGWVHKSGDNWLQYDDDIVTTVKTDEIMALRGGGDWHMSYILIYRKMEVGGVAIEEEDAKME